MRENNGLRKKHPCRTSCVLSDALNLRHQLRSRNQLKSFSEKFLLSQNYVTSDGAVSHSVLFHQQLYVTRYQVSCYANNYLRSAFLKALRK